MGGGDVQILARKLVTPGNLFRAGIVGRRTSFETVIHGACSVTCAASAENHSARSPVLRWPACITRIGSIPLPSAWPAVRLFARRPLR